MRALTKNHHSFKTEILAQVYDKDNAKLGSSGVENTRHFLFYYVYLDRERERERHTHTRTYKYTYSHRHLHIYKQKTRSGLFSLQ